MPSPAAVLEQVTDILVRVVGCPSDAVVPDAELKDLGTDSLTVVELGEELGRRFDLYLSDDTIDGLVTVQDAIDAVVRHDGSQPPRGAASIPAALAVKPPASEAPTNEVVPVDEHEIAERRSKARGFAVWFAIIGIVVGGVLGIGGAALVSATGIDQVDLPPLGAPDTPEPTPTRSATPTPTPTATTGEPQPTIDASSTQVAPGERFTLSGVFPGSESGEALQVEVKDEGAEWDDFPIEPVTRDGGTFKTELYTSRTGTREFRVTNTVTGTSSPAVTIEIG